MKLLTANLATRPFRNNTVIGSIVAAAALGLVVATIYNLYVFLSYGSSYALLLDDQDRNRSKLEELEREEGSLVGQIEARDFETAFDRGSVANELILKRTFSWTELFNKLEALIPAEVMMSAIRPNVTSSAIVIRVEGVAKTHTAFLELQEHLLAHEAFSDVYPASIRRLNPSRPEITFILNFNYRQSARPPTDTVVAQAAAQPAPAVSAAAAAAGGREGATGGAPSLHDEILRAAAAANALPVGRDGRPRTLEVIARRMVAPGGVYVPPAGRPPGPTADEVRRGSAPPAAATAAGAPEVAPPRVTGEPLAQAGPASPEPGSESSAAVQLGAPPAGGPEDMAGVDAGGAGMVGQQAGAPEPSAPTPETRAEVPPMTQPPATATPERSRQLQRRRAIVAGRGGGAAPGATGVRPGAARAAQTVPGAGEPAASATAPPAGRPDLDLNFINQPVHEVYRLLGKAHGVRFIVDAAIDRNAPLNVDLSGRSLPEVIAMMAGIANHRIMQLRPGIYQVVAISAGDSLVEPPVEEEDLPGTEGAP